MRYYLDMRCRLFLFSVITARNLPYLADYGEKEIRGGVVGRQPYLVHIEEQISTENCSHDVHTNIEMAFDQYNRSAS